MADQYTTTRSVQFREQASNTLQDLWSRQFSSPTLKPRAKRLPRTSSSRLVDSATDEKTILYLAYGSNLSAETFEGTRGIRPLSAANVHVPSLDLAFDLSGIPYAEPCFANSRYRKAPPTPPASKDGYHKNTWLKGLIGVVYEVTPEDFRTIIATEGGGASYQDVIVPCYALPAGGKTVDPHPSGSPFKAHTLLMPTSNAKSRPDPGYAQPSARYRKLITDGGEEHELPAEYMAYLYGIRPYTITTYRQRVGQALFLLFWFPIVMAVFGLSKIFADSEGKIPKWLVQVTNVMFRAVWASYDNMFKGVFGDGERTIEQKGDEEAANIKELMPI